MFLESSLNTHFGPPTKYKSCRKHNKKCDNVFKPLSQKNMLKLQNTFLKLVRGGIYPPKNSPAPTKG